MIAEEYKECCNRYLQMFCEKHGYDCYSWIDVGRTAEVGGYEFAFDDIRYDIEQNLPKGKIEEWYDYDAQIRALGLHQALTLKTFCQGVPVPFPPYRIEKLRNKRKNYVLAPTDFV